MALGCGKSHEDGMQRMEVFKILSDLRVACLVSIDCCFGQRKHLSVSCICFEDAQWKFIYTLHLFRG